LLHCCHHHQNQTPRCLTSVTSAAADDATETPRLETVKGKGRELGCLSQAAAVVAAGRVDGGADPYAVAHGIAVAAAAAAAAPVPASPVPADFQSWLLAHAGLWDCA